MTDSLTDANATWTIGPIFKQESEPKLFEQTLVCVQQRSTQKANSLCKDTHQNISAQIYSCLFTTIPVNGY